MYIFIAGKDLSFTVNNGRILKTHNFLSSSPSFNKAVWMYIPRIDAFKEILALQLSESEMKAIIRIRQLCLKQCFNILHAPAPIWCVTFPPWSVHHAYYCLLFWETPCCAVCRVKCRGFTKRLCPPGPAPQQLWLIKWILSTREKLVLYSAPSRISTQNSCLVPKAQTSNFQMPTQSGLITTISPVKNVRWMVIFCFMNSQELWVYHLRDTLS